MIVTGRMIRIGTLLACCSMANADFPWPTAGPRPRICQMVEANEIQQELDRHRLERRSRARSWKVTRSTSRWNTRSTPPSITGTTTLKLEALGPRVPKPNAPKPVSFENTQHLWYGDQSVKIAPGRGRHVFPLTIPRASPQNDLLLLASFSDGRGKRWPWDVRASAWYARKGGYFELGTEKPGNLFTYDEPVRLAARLKNVRTPGQQKVLTYKVYDFTKAVVAQGSVPFTVERNGQKVPVSLDLARRGTFLFQAEVDGLGDARDDVLPHSRSGGDHRRQADAVGVHRPRRAAHRLSHAGDV